MPEKVGFSRLKLVRRADMPPPPVERAAYVELGVTSPFSFLRGASDAIELVFRALELSMDSIGIADPARVVECDRDRQRAFEARARMSDRWPADIEELLAVYALDRLCFTFQLVLLVFNTQCQQIIAR